MCPRCHTLITQQHTGVATATDVAAPVVSVPDAPVPVVPISPQSIATTPVVHVPASVWKRFGNYLIDVILVSVITGIATAIIMKDAPFLISILISSGSTIVFYTVFEGLWARTPGKFLTGTKVVMKDGSKPGFSTILLRSVVRIVPFEALTFLFNSNPVGWHDAWSGTFVVPVSYSQSDVQAIQSGPKRSGFFIILIIIGGLLLIAVIGIVASIFLSSLNSARMQGRDTRRVLDVKQLQVALELYLDANGHYPAVLSEIPQTDIPAVPLDPSTNALYPYVLCGTGAYHMAATLETQAGQLSNDADSPPLCAEDTISGDDAHSCISDASAVAGHCFDVTSQADQTPQTPST